MISLSLVWKASGDLDGKTRLDENHVPQVGGWMDASLQMDRKLACLKIHVPQVCTTGLQEGRPSGDLDGKLDWMRTMSHRWMPLCRWTEN
jgi:hypothetical protein